MDTNTGMGPADFSALMGNTNGSCNNAFIWIIVLFLLISMNGWNRNNGDYGQYATAASQQDILFNQKFTNLANQATANYQSLDNKVDRIGNGIADATFALNNTIHNAQDVVAGAVTTEGRGIQGQIAAEGRGFQQQIGEGFCGVNRNIDAIRYENQKLAGDITAAIHADGEATRALIKDNEIRTLRDKVSSLEMDNRMCGVVRYPMSYTYSAGQSPFCNCNCNNNCC